MLLKSFFAVLFACFFSLVLYAQPTNPLKRNGPIGMAKFKRGDFYAKITYGRPKMKTDRSYPFGYNVPWRKVWRTGMDDATEITLTGPVEIDGQKLEAGTYSLFTIPDTASWTVIFNREQGLWGTYKYSTSKDVLRAKAERYTAPRQFLEMTIFMEGTPKGADLFIVWDRTSVRLPMTILREEEETGGND